MAIIYKKGQKDLEYTGADKVMKMFGDGLEKIKSGARKVGSVYSNAAADKKKGDARRELDSINRGFGGHGTENYEKLYPDTKKRNDELRKQAGY